MSSSSVFSKLKPGAHVHLIGICGTAMASLAGLLKDRGFKVTGSDLNPYPPMSTQLESLGIQIQKGYEAKNLHPVPDLVIVGNVVSADNPEAVEMKSLGVAYTSLPVAMGELIIADRESIVVSGTHGKTTTSSMMAWVTDQAGLRPGFLIGGIPKNYGVSFRNPAGNYFVIEGDEYDTAYFDKVPKFIHYKPKHVILTSIEFDHADIYEDLSAVKSAFSRLLKLIPEAGTLVYNVHDQNIQELLPQATRGRRVSYGLGEGDFAAEILKQSPQGTEFLVKHKGETLGKYSILLTGHYNVLNATAVVALSHVLKYDAARVTAALKSFEGVKRRQEILGEPNGILVIEDFAHHPTAVNVTLTGLSKSYPGRKILAVFEPRSATSRRSIFQKDYADAFMTAHEIYLAEAFNQIKISESERFSSETLASDLRKREKSARAFHSVDEIVAALKQSAKPGDLIVIMSNGGFDGIYKKLLTALESH